VWDRLENIPCPPGVPPASAESDDRVFRGGNAPAVALDCFDGPTYFSATKDGGRSWSKPQIIVPTPANEQTIANQIVVDPRSHTLYDFYMYIDRHDVFTVENVASHDGGKSWGPRQLVSESQVVGVVDPATGAPIRTGDIIPEPAIDPRSGRLYAVWQDPRFNRVDPNEHQVLISSSSFGGLAGTWSDPVLVNDPNDRAAFTPAVKVLRGGRVAVQYYTFDGNGRGGTLPTDLVLCVSEFGTHFDDRAQTVARPFNMLAAPFASGFFTGDYEGLAVDAFGVLHGFATLTNCRDFRCAAVAGFDADGNPIPSGAPNPTDVFTFSVGGGLR